MKGSFRIGVAATTPGVASEALDKPLTRLIRLGPVGDGGLRRGEREDRQVVGPVPQVQRLQLRERPHEQAGAAEHHDGKGDLNRDQPVARAASTVYVITEFKTAGTLFRSDDYGETFRMINDDRNLDFRPFYYVVARLDRNAAHRPGSAEDPDELAGQDDQLTPCTSISKRRPPSRSGAVVVSLCRSLPCNDHEAIRTRRIQASIAPATLESLSSSIMNARIGSAPSGTLL